MTDPRAIPKITLLRMKLADDAARLRALWCEHTTEDTLDFEDRNVRIILDAPRRDDASSTAAVECGRQLAELMDSGPRLRAELVDLLVLITPIDHLRTMVRELQDCSRT